MEYLVLLLLAAGFFLIVWGFLAFIKALFAPRSQTLSSPRASQPTDDIDGMNEGDYYNGPSGYSATGGYRNSYYGRQFDDDEHE